MPAVPLKVSPDTLATLSDDERKAALREVALERYQRPRANPLVMWISRILIDHLGCPGIPLIGRIAFLRRHVPFVAGLRLMAFDLPRDDEARLRRALDPANACFVSANHPELFTDVIVDWRVMSRIAKRIAFWAGYAIVNNPLLRRFWLNHNLIATSPGGDGKHYSIECARRGDGVLIHPEGNVQWTNDHLHPIFPGVATLALDTAATSASVGDARPTRIVPMLWKYRFVDDASAGLHRELRFVERRLGLPDGAHLDVGARFFAAMRELLLREERAAGLEERPLDDAEYFARSEALLASLLASTERELAIAPEHEDPRLRILAVEKRARFLKARDPARYREMTRRVATLRRLYHFSPRFYGGATMTQEHMAESLKRVRQDLVEGKLTDELRRWIPFGCADRVVHIRVGAPIDVDAFLARPDVRALGPGARVEALRALVEREMRTVLDGVVAETAPQCARFAVPNRFATTHA